MMKKLNPYRDRALLKFKRYFFHATRNGDDPETAATNAMWKTREEIYELLINDKVFETDFDREEAWADALMDLMQFRQLLVDLKRADPLIMPKHHIEEIQQEKETASGHIAKTIEAGLQQQVNLEDEKDG